MKGSDTTPAGPIHAGHLSQSSASVPLPFASARHTSSRNALPTPQRYNTNKRLQQRQLVPYLKPLNSATFMSNKLLVIGNGLVGHRLLESLAAAETMSEITVLCEEPRPAYDRVQLSAFFSGKTAADLSMVSDGFFAQHNIALHLNDKAESIDRTKKIVRSAQGRELSYDKLVIATGSYPFVPPVPGHNREHCLVYRTIET